MPHTCEQTVTEYFAALRALDAERWANTFAVDGITHDPVGTPPKVGRAALRQFMGELASAFRSLSLVEQNVFINANSAAVKWNATAVAHSGKAVDFDGVDVIDCNEEGKIVLVRAFWDPGPVMAIVQP